MHGCRQRGQEGRAPRPRIFIHGTDIVDIGLIVLFFGLFFVPSPLRRGLIMLSVGLFCLPPPLEIFLPVFHIIFIIPLIFRCYFRSVLLDLTHIAVGDRIVLKMQDFDFCLNFSHFCSFSSKFTKFCPNFAQICPNFVQKISKRLRLHPLNPQFLRHFLFNLIKELTLSFKLIALISIASIVALLLTRQATNLK